MKSEDVLSYSDEANATRYVLLKDNNDINFFVEDKEKEYEYEPIFKRLFGDEYNISSIFGVGGKEMLIERFNEFGTVDADDPSKINVYIADGDFDILLNPQDMIINDNFIYLEAYNIEVYYIDENAIVEYLCGYFKQQKTTVSQKLNFTYWLNTSIRQLKKLFLCFCYVQKFCYGEKNVDWGPGRFIDEKTGFERNDSIENYLIDILTKTNISREDYEKEIANIEADFNSIHGENYILLICGKYLLHSLYYYSESLLGKKNLNYDMLKWDLIRNFDVRKLDYIKNRVNIITERNK